MPFSLLIIERLEHVIGLRWAPCPARNSSVGRLRAIRRRQQAGGHAHPHVLQPRRLLPTLHRLALHALLHHGMEDGRRAQGAGRLLHRLVVAVARPHAHGQLRRIAQRPVVDDSCWSCRSWPPAAVRQLQVLRKGAERQPGGGRDRSGRCSACKPGGVDQALGVRLLDIVRGSCRPCRWTCRMYTGSSLR